MKEDGGADEVEVPRGKGIRGGGRGAQHDDRVPVMILTFMMDTTRVEEGCMNINTTIVKRSLQLVAAYLNRVVSTNSFLANIPFYNFTLSLVFLLYNVMKLLLACHSLSPTTAR